MSLTAACTVGGDSIDPDHLGKSDPSAEQSYFAGSGGDDGEGGDNGWPQCDPEPEDCNNGIDDDCDGRIDQDQAPECAVLLVELESFSAEQTRQGVVLRWSTISEIGNLGFRLIREKVPAVAGKSGGDAPVAIQINQAVSDRNRR